MTEPKIDSPRKMGWFDITLRFIGYCSIIGSMILLAHGLLVFDGYAYGWGLALFGLGLIAILVSEMGFMNEVGS